MTSDQQQRISMAALELAAALNAASAEFDVRVDSAIAAQVGGARKCVYGVEVFHLRPIILVPA